MKTIELSVKTIKAKNVAQKEFISSTIGMQAYHDNMTQARLIRVEFYSTPQSVLLIPVSGHSLATIKTIPQVLISSEEFDNRDFDYYNNTVEFFWAIKKLGFSLSVDSEY